MVVQLGHHGERCQKHTSIPDTLVAIDLSGVQKVRVQWCRCGHDEDGLVRRTQLMRLGWFPASVDRPGTFATFQVLNFFHLLTLQAKATVYDFFEVLLHRQDNSGLSASYVLLYDSSSLVLTLT